MTDWSRESDKSLKNNLGFAKKKLKEATTTERIEQLEKVIKDIEWVLRIRNQQKED